MPRDFFHGRHAGLLVPLFSLPSRESWGIGEIGDLPRLGAWMADAGFSFVQLLPINEMADGQNSPYSAMSAMAIDPIFISPAAVPDIGTLGGESLLTRPARALLAKARASKSIDYAAVRTVKLFALRAAFDHFREHEWKRDTNRALRLKAFIDHARWWIDDYALFRALHARARGRAWQEWDAPLRDRDPGALLAAREELATEILFHSYLQWLAANQWRQAREACDIGVFGDFPFMVSGDSADVWSRQQDFRLDASVGAPPDAFSETGQDWGFPAYRWDVVAAGDYEWLADRARRRSAGALRRLPRRSSRRLLPHLRPREGRRGGLRAAGRARSDRPGRGGAQGPQRHRLADHRRGSRRDPRVRARDTRSASRSPATRSCAGSGSGTRTGSPSGIRARIPPAAWRRAARTTPSRWRSGGTRRRLPNGRRWPRSITTGRRTPSPRSRSTTRRATRSCSCSTPPASDIVLLPIQDVFGWKDRINTPALINDDNWTWRLPWLVEDMVNEPSARDRGVFARRLAERFGRADPLISRV